MTFLPIVERELRVAARKKGTHWLWFSAGLVAMTAAFMVLVGGQVSTAPQSLGRWVFSVISALAFAFSLLAGVFLTSDCLCSEKRDGTLGLLFLTDLKGYDVVVGKLVATSIVSVYALLAIIPMLGLPLLMGGVSLAEFVRMTLVLLATLFLSLATGMYASAVSAETRGAMLRSFGVMLGLTGGLVGITWALQFVLDWRAAEYFGVPSPFAAFMLSREPRYNLLWYASGYWISLGCVFAMGLAQLIAACRLLPWSWQASGTEAMSGRPDRLRPGRLTGNPFQWLLERDSFPGPFTRLAAGLLFLVWCGFLAATFLVGRMDQDEMMMASLVGAVVLQLLTKGLLVVQATRRFSEDRRSGALELLLTTPIEVKAILDAQRAVLRRQFQWFQTGLLGANLGLIVALIFVMGARWNNWEPVIIFSIFCMGGMALWFVDAHALVWTGMWKALSGQRHHRTALNTIGWVMAPSWVALLLLIFLLSTGRSSGADVCAAWLMWFVFSMVWTVTAGIGHENKLRNGFRQAASGDQPPANGEDTGQPQPTDPVPATSPPRA
jgi:ABC-type transport system involved in cytochrome c biogenesis permease component